MSEEVIIGPQRCNYCGGEYGEHDEDCANKLPQPESEKCPNPACHNGEIWHMNNGTGYWRKCQTCEGTGVNGKEGSEH